MTHNETDTEHFITIVSGLPRSGTSMMMQMLAAGGIPPLADNIRQPDEDNPRGYYEFEQVKQVERDTSWLDDAEGKVVKMVYRLLYDLPADRFYRVVFMTRELSEVIASQRVMLERHGNAGDQLSEDRLAEIYHRHLQDVMNWLEAQPNFSVLPVDYHAVLKESESVAGQLNAFLGGRMNVDAMLSVPEWSLYRQRQEGTAATGNP